MTFKLGRSIKNYMDRGEIKNKFIFKRDDASVPGTPVYRVPLDTAGEAMKDGSIRINNKIEPGSEKEREVLIHEMKHIVDMKTGKLAYDDDWVKWNGRYYDRKDGMINFDGKWLPEGDRSFPWEIEAYKYNTNK